MPVTARPRPASLPLPGGQADAAVRVHPLLAAEALTPPGMFIRPAGPMARLRGVGLLTPRSRWHWAPVPAFLIEHPGAGPFLIDTGFHPSVADDLRQSLGRRGALFYRIRMSSDQGIRAQLHARGVDPEQIRLVVMTHLHFDHASGVSEFPAATFVLDRREWAAASGQGFLHGYRAAHFDHPFDWRTLDYEAPAVGSFETFAHSLDLFGDGSVRLLSTPGHTYGHQSLLLRLTDRSLLLTGDAAYMRRTLDETIVPALYEDEHLYLRSLKEIQAFVKGAPDTVVIAGHDAETWPTLEPVYG
jgi:glyoxylase-like metal-dependent hydrolase (beta-lactamase superfamily II)